jgi:hypothetical protein
MAPQRKQQLIGCMSHVNVRLWPKDGRAVAVLPCYERRLMPHRINQITASAPISASFPRWAKGEALKIWPVDNVRNNGSQLILPVLSNEVSA